MTALDDRTVTPSVTTGPIQGSHKVYVEGPDDLRIPVRRVDLTNGEHFDLYDTSGPYTDTNATAPALTRHVTPSGVPRVGDSVRASRGFRPRESRILSAGELGGHRDD
ncbi:MAG TPA: hypothetical protein VK735_05290, partial [Pseudonocardia sp.]|nr:hypothetical protein [Pseudonocardia sp.]